MNTNYNQTQKMDLEQIHHILVIEDPSFVREIQLDAATYSIGRHSSNDIVLSCQKTSRNHATILRRTDAKTGQYSYWILDGDLQGNRSRNGIYINGKKSLVHELQPGDIVHFSGDASVRYNTSTEPLKNTIQGDEQNLAYVANSPAPGVNRDILINKETVVSVDENDSPRIERSIDNSLQFSLAELSPQPIIEIDLYGNITYINSAGIIGFKDIHHRKLNHPLLEDLVAQYHQGHEHIISREVKVDEETFQQIAQYLPEKRVIRNYLTNITQQKKLEQELHQVKTFYNRLTEQISEGIMLVELATKQVIEANSACSKLLGYSAAELLQMNVYELVDQSEKFALVIKSIIAEDNSFEGEYYLRHKNSNLIQTQVQISIIRFALEESICLIIRPVGGKATIDAVEQASSQLFKRELFSQQLLTAIANAKRSHKLLAVIFCKLDFLPDINVSIGEDNYEKLLLALEKRLDTCLRAGDTVIRWQEDKFALLLPLVSDIEEVTKIIQRINQSTHQSFSLGKTKASISSVTGIAVYPQDGIDPEILMASANTALERASSNKSDYQFYDDAMNSQALVALELEGLLQQAIEQEEFELYYQPQINVDSGKMQAVEALLRWQHPELGLVAPGNFMRIAERTKLIVPIGEWTIRTACIQSKQWQTEAMPASRIIVSLSLVQFQQSDLPQRIEEILSETDFDPSFLELEISAPSLMDNIDHSRHIISQLKSLGVKIAVDGFTTGFSALEYLKQIPLDTLKIDRALVQQLTDSPQDLAIVTALIEIGKGFDLRIVAEGVETQEQVELLRGLNCHYMQGYWFGRPLGANEAGKLLKLDDSTEAMTKPQPATPLSSTQEMPEEMPLEASEPSQDEH
jgi:diguanylate cyclase (GGDEF)-like protein/PAS domain S-box-containing protein